MTKAKAKARTGAVKKTAAAPKRRVETDNVIDPNTISPQMLRFVDAYIVCMNGTEAARQAKYGGDDATLAVTASRLLRNHKVLSEIDRRLKQFTMPANEVLIHLTDIARGDIGDMLSVAGGIDATEARRRGKSHLIKRLKVKTVTSDDQEIIETEIELYDRLDALKTLAKFHMLLVDRVRQEDWRTDVIALLRDGKLTPEQVKHELGTELAQELFAAVGLPVTSA